MFRPEDAIFSLFYQLLRNKKYTIEGAKEHIKDIKRKPILQLLQLLQKFKDFLLDMRANLGGMKKLAYYFLFISLVLISFCSISKQSGTAFAKDIIIKDSAASNFERKN